MQNCAISSFLLSLAIMAIYINETTPLYVKRAENHPKKSKILYASVIKMIPQKSLFVNWITTFYFFS